MSDDNAAKDTGFAFMTELPSVTFSRRPPASRKEAADSDVVWEVESLDQVIEEADRRLGTSGDKRGGDVSA